MAISGIVNNLVNQSFGLISTLPNNAFTFTSRGGLLGQATGLQVAAESSFGFSPSSPVFNNTFSGTTFGNFVISSSIHSNLNSFSPFFGGSSVAPSFLDVLV